MTGALILVAIDLTCRDVRISLSNAGQCLGCGLPASWPMRANSSCASLSSAMLYESLTMAIKLCIVCVLCVAYGC